MTQKIENKALRDYIYEQILDLIDRGVLRVGQKINKKELGKRFGVSQTPINDALNKLVGERYIEVQPRKGYFIREFGTDEFCQIFEMRAGLEGIAARLCCENASEEELHRLVTSFDGFTLPLDEEEMKRYYEVDRWFHEKIVQYSANAFIYDALKTTGFQSRSYQKGLVRGPEITLPEHMMIIEALKDRDGERAQRMTIFHLLNSRDVFKFRMNQRNNGKLDES